MKSTVFAALVTTLSIFSALYRTPLTSRDLAASPTVVRMKSLQDEIEKQQIEVTTLNLRTEKLQKEMEQLADIVADQTSQPSDDDRESNIPTARVHMRYKVKKRSPSDHKRVTRPLVLARVPRDTAQHSPQCGGHCG